MLTGRNIIAIASNWHFDPTSKHHVMSLLSRHNDVLWVNYHGSRRPRACAADLTAMLRRIRQVGRAPQPIGERMRAITPLVIPLPGAEWARRVNRKWVAGQIRAALRGLPRRPVQLWSFAPDVDYLAGQFGEELDLYYCVDAFSEFTHYDAGAIARREAALMARCDVVITTARHLYDAKRALHGNVHLVPHGVSFDHFARAADPQLAVHPALRQIPRPIFGFFGMIQDWVDLELVGTIARRRPEWSFVFLGRAEVPLQPWDHQANIHFLGQVPFADLPSYCKGFDVALIPFKVNALTRAVNPIKLREYLAAGLPVVASDLPEVRAYQPHVLTARTPQAFEAACAQALQQRTPEHQRRRQDAVRHETWERKVEQLSGIVAAALQQGKPMGSPGDHARADSGVTSDRLQEAETR